MVPALAKSWEFDEETCTYTFHLEEDVYKRQALCVFKEKGTEHGGITGGKASVCQL